MKKVLIITYYWPPSGGGGVQRWLKFAKCLPAQGWQPIIYTPLNPSFNLMDKSLEKDVPAEAMIIKRKIREPYKMYEKLRLGSQKESNVGLYEFAGDKPGIKGRLVSWVRNNFFMPDPRRYWIKPSIRFLVKNIDKINPDAIITTGPPHSMHLIGLGIKEKTGLPWISDFRDPWSRLDLLRKYGADEKALKRHRQLEKKVITSSDVTLTVSREWAEMFKQDGSQSVQVITNGFDQDDFASETSHPGPLKFTICHLGLLHQMRNPSHLWKALDKLCSEKPEFKSNLEIRLGGSVGQSVKNQIMSLQNIADLTTFLGYVGHDEVLEEYANSAVLLLLLNDSDIGKGNIPGKLFEYLAAKKPILTIGQPGSDAERIIRETQSGMVHSYQESEDLQKSLQQLYDNWQAGILVEPIGVERYSRENLTKDLAELLSRIA